MNFYDWRTMDFCEFKSILTGEFPGLTGEQLSRFEAMDGLYREWNSKINVISRRDVDNLYEHHVLHSLGVAMYLKRRLPETFREWGGDALCRDSGCRPAEAPVTGQLAEVSVLDLGCGGGFPGIPLATLFPGVRFTLCDSIGKKVTVSREISAALGLKNVETVNARAESLAGTFDYVVSRAVTSLDRFLPWVKGKCRKEIFCLKGGDLVEEIAEAAGKCRLPEGSVEVWPISSVLGDGFFDGKTLVGIRMRSL